MDDELQQLEAELQRLQPPPVAPRLTERVGAALARAPKRRPPAEVHWLWAALPAAAAVVLVFAEFARERAADQPALAVARSESKPGWRDSDGAFKPVAAEHVLVAAADEGLVTLADGSPARRERLQFVDTITWRNAQTNASLTWEVPREEVRVVPVSFQ